MILFSLSNSKFLIQLFYLTDLVSRGSLKTAFNQLNHGDSLENFFSCDDLQSSLCSLQDQSTTGW